MKSNEKGFSIIEALLALIALTLIGFVGFYVYNANKKTDQSNASQTKAADSPIATKTDTNTKAETKKLAIKELGISLALDASTQDVKYSLMQEGAKSVTLTSASFTKLEAGCNDTGFSFFGSLVRHEGTYNEATSDPLIYEEMVNQFKDFYITYSTPDGGFCKSGDAEMAKSVNAKADELKAGVIKAAKSAIVL